MPRVKLFNEEEVLKKAMLLFWQQGYYHTSVQDLVNTLGINRASLYATFGGKKQLYHAAFKLYRDSNREGLAKFLSTQPAVKKALRSVFEKIIREDGNDEDRKGCFIVNTTTELVPSDKVLQELIDVNRLETQKIFIAFLQKGVSRGEISPEKNLEVIASLLYTFMTGLRVLGKTQPSIQESLASVDTFLTLLD